MERDARSGGGPARARRARGARTPRRSRGPIVIGAAVLLLVAGGLYVSYRVRSASRRGGTPDGAARVPASASSEGEEAAPPSGQFAAPGFVAAVGDFDPVEALAASADYGAAKVVQARRPATTSSEVPAGENLLRPVADHDGLAVLTVGGTGGWMSDGKVQVRAEDLTDGRKDGLETPWLHLDELFWDGQSGRQMWAEITFLGSANVDSLTVYEDPGHPESWPTEALVQVWDGKLKRWNTASFGVFLDGPVNTYRLGLKGVHKVRYVPWSSYYRNFYTSEIEVRGQVEMKGDFPMYSYIGPFSNADRKGFATVYPPEREIDIEKTYREGVSGAEAATWRRGVPDGKGYFDLGQRFTLEGGGAREWVVAYAVMFVDSPAERKAKISVGSDDGVKVWLNDEVVISSDAYRGAQPGQDEAVVTLRKGRNELLVKVTQGTGGWGFYLSLLDEAGEPLAASEEGLSYSCTPE